MARNKRDVIFTLDENSQIIMRPGGSIEMQQMHCCNLAKVFFVKDNNEHTISYYSLPFYHEILDTYSRLIFNAIADELRLPESFNKDIGYIYNEYEMKNHSKVYPMSIKLNEEFCFSNYQLFRSASKNSWLYNDKDGSIVLEIGPSYPWDSYKKRTKGLISFKKFLKNYAPFYKTKIPVDLAYQWLKQILYLKQVINENVIKTRERRVDRNKPQDASALKLEYDFPAIVLSDMYGYMRKDLSEKHKEIFIRAGFSDCAYWWQNLTDAEQNELIDYDAEKVPRVYEEMP